MKNLTKNEKIAVGISLFVIGFFFYFGGTVINVFKTGQFSSSNSEVSAVTPAPELGIQEISLGTGDSVNLGDAVTVNYTGAFVDGKVFDSSVARNEPFTFVVGAGQVISGWDQGLVGMKVGGKRILVVPPQLGYGDKDYGPIPANSTLIFQIELLSVKK